MAIDLTPAEVVAQIADAGVTDGAGIEGREVRWLEWSVGEVGGPEIDVEGCEGGEDGGEEFGGPALEEHGAFMEDEAGNLRKNMRLGVERGV